MHTLVSVWCQIIREHTFQSTGCEDLGWIGLDCRGKADVPGISLVSLRESKENSLFFLIRKLDWSISSLSSIFRLTFLLFYKHSYYSPILKTTKITNNNNENILSTFHVPPETPSPPAFLTLSSFLKEHHIKSIFNAYPSFILSPLILLVWY